MNDDLVQELMEWHFGENGSRFWRETVLPFDPRKDVRTVEDLRLFPDLSEHWRTTPVRDLVPAGASGYVRVFESGGTTGSPKRIVESSFCRETYPWLSSLLNVHGTPRSGDWLLLGPTGPHIVGYSIGGLAHHRGSLCHFVDLDARWVKTCIRAGDFVTVGKYVEHVLDQAVDVLSTQDIRVLVSTPPILEAICKRPAARDLVQEKVRAIIWAGTSTSRESLRLLEEEIFPDAALIGMYGNTMGGVSLQRPRVPEDTEPCVFQTFQPNCIVELLSPDGDLVEYGQRGRVRSTVLCRDYFMPNVMERDTALRIAPVADFPWDGVADVRPPEDGPVVVEGVY
ncbi:phenazine antibiotic biosynthesis protein [Lentzea sp. NBRC 105346]|uniref:phenazine antibiotic biosynthesis protein n=1 Tax=Lentzea sp. NBRC 105346 TaxID=3032205 RepID=UPI0024A3BE21|nr:phenazine antibiotic biosynthesis protein [Lentzea sp. NBRC 105346]GLZ28704.1 phenazine antibiotic biosynthesis protein [Lentzea sp. NBRC 105346]